MTDEEFRTIVLSQLQSINEGLWGKPNTDDKGLAGKVREVCESHYKLKGQVTLLIGVLIGSGVLGSGIYGVTRLIGR